MQPTAEMTPGIAMNLLQAGQFVRAASVLGEALRQQPDHAPSWHLLAVAHMQGQKPLDALPAAISAVRFAPGNGEYVYTLGRVYKACGNPLTAVAYYRAALQITPGDVRLLVSLGVALRSLGQRTEAMHWYQQALQVDPRSREARTNLANAQEADLDARETPAEAAERLRQLAAAEAQRLFDIGEACLQKGQSHEARAVLWDARQLAPDSALIEYRYGCALHDLGNAAGALEHFSSAAQKQPAFFDAVDAAAGAASVFGLAEQARRYDERALELRPSDAIRLRMKLGTPAIQESRAGIAAVRSDFDAALDELLETPPTVANPLAIGENKTFYLAYHGECNRDLHRKLAQVFLRACPELAWQAPHCLDYKRTPRRIRVGFVSQFMRDHSIGKTTRGLVAELSRERFEVFVLNIPPVRDDQTTRWTRAHSEHWLALEPSLAACRQQIADLLLDILFYQDVGMDPFAYFLAFSRLAPVQCLSFGHPDTTGIPTMDYFVSSDLFETPAAADHYSERLVTLRDLPTLAYYYRPTPPEQALISRAEFNLSGAEHIYTCPQTLFKLHPDFDAIMAGILRSDERGRIVLISGNCPAWDDLLRARFQRVMTDVTDRISFVPRMSNAQFRRLLAVSDVVLDTVHFNGMNSSLEAFAQGVPVVTLPTALQRGRHTQAMYRSMQISDGIAADADDYVRRAVCLGTDPASRETLKNQILERSHVLFEDRRVISEFERFFESAVAALADGNRAMELVTSR